MMPNKTKKAAADRSLILKVGKAAVKNGKRVIRTSESDGDKNCKT